VGLIEVAAGELHVGARFLDEGFRRASEVDCRVLPPGRLFVIQQRAGPIQDAAPCGYPGEEWLHVITASPDGIINECKTFPDGRMSDGTRRGEVDDYWMDAPEFGDWGTFIRSFPEALDAAGLDVPESVVVRDISSPDGTGLPAGERPWRAPRGLAPDPSYLAWLFTAGTRLTYDITGGMWVTDNDEKIKKVTVEVLDAGTLRMPSGRLVAKDPSWFTDAEPFTVTVAPGSYPVLVSVVRFAGNPDHTRVAAAKIVIRDIPAESWEMALRAGQDSRALPDASFYGFGVDAGTGCFFDASAAARFSRLDWRDIGEAIWDAITAPVSDAESGANMIAFRSGWGDGSYPVWIGRSADGEVACFVADMLLMPGNVTLDAD